MQKENPMHCVIAMVCLLIAASALGVQVMRAGVVAPAEHLAADSDGRIHHPPAELLEEFSRHLATQPAE